MFEPGKEKTGGRKPGVKNKKTVLRAEEMMADLKFNPVKNMIDLALATSTPIDQKVKLLIELNALINPKAKATEPDEDSPPDKTPKEPPKLSVVQNKRLTELLKKPHGKGPDT